MRKLTIAAAALMTATAAWGQAQFNFNTRDLAVGNDVSFVFNGLPATGSDLFVEVLAGPDANSLVALAPTLALNRSGAFAGYTSPFAAFYTVPGLASGQTAVVAFRAFQGSSYETALNRSDLVLASVVLTGSPIPPNEVALGVRTVCIGCLPPKITSSLQDQLVCSGASVTFTVTATGTAPLAYQWRKSEVIISGATGPSLVLNNLSASDAGTYTVLVSNLAGNATAKATLTVASPPTISTVADQIVQIGGSTPTLAFQVNGGTLVTASSSNQALVPDANIILAGSGANRTVQVIGAAGQSGTTTITLSVTDSLCQVVSITFKVSTQAPPVNTPPMISQIDNQTITVGGTFPIVTFTVGDAETAVGELPVDATSSNSSLIPNSGLFLSGSGATRSMLLNPTSGQVGSSLIIVTVTDGGGKSASTSFTATVNRINDAPTITIQPQSQTVKPGSSVTFTVSATGTAPLSYQWQKNGVDISGATGSSLVLNSVTASDAGTYTVLVSNVAGSATSAGAVLSVNSTPVITLQPQNQTINPGASVTFTVSATGTPPLAYQWQRNGADISGATGPSLVLNNATAFDVGTYTVRVSNLAGSATSAGAVLSVNSPPGITLQPQNQTVNPGASLTFTVSAIGTPPLAYQWQRNGADISGATGPSLVLNNVTAFDVGTYTVRVSNLAGSATSAGAVLGVNSPPGITLQPQNQTVNSGASVTFTVSAIGTPPLAYQWQRNGADISGATGPSLVLNNVTAFDVGTYTVRVSNLAGSATSAGAVLSVNSPPVLSDIELRPLIYTATPPATPITATLTVSDVDNSTLAGATVQISTNYVNGQDILAMTARANIAANFDAGTGTLTLIGTDTLANYQAALRAVTYQNLSNNPSPLPRTITFQVDDGMAVNHLSAAVSRSITMANAPPANDNFANAQLLPTGLQGSASGANLSATREEGEPYHGGFGDHSIWFKWQPSLQGVFAFDTQGSDFDTLLAVYTSNNSTPTFRDLIGVATNDDLTPTSPDGTRTPVITSEVNFLADPAREYFIAVDGVGEATGHIELNWNPVDFLISGPTNQVVAEHDSAIFSVSTTPAGTTYQWRLNGRALNSGGHYTGTLGPTLRIVDAGADQVGNYDVIVGTPSGSRQSLSASLQVNSPDNPEIFARDKLVEIPSDAPGAASTAALQSYLLTTGSAQAISLASSSPVVGLGSITFNTEGFTVDVGEDKLRHWTNSNESATNWGASAWTRATAKTNARVAVSIVATNLVAGHPFVPFVVVYQGRQFIDSFSSLNDTHKFQFLGSNKTNGIFSTKFTFAAKTNLYYHVAAYGRRVPKVPPMGQAQASRAGLDPQALRQQAPLSNPGKRISSQIAAAANSATADFETGTVILDFKETDPLIQLAASALSDGTRQVTVLGDSSSGIVIQSSSNLRDWRGIAIEQPFSGEFEFVDRDLPLAGPRFYRSVEIEPAELLQLSLADLGGGQIHLSSAGVSKTALLAQASTNLIDWSTLATNYAYNGAIDFISREPGNSGALYYRAVAVQSPEPFSISGGGWTNQIFQLLVSSTIGPSLVVQSSANLVAWTGIATNGPLVNTITFIDPDAASHPRRYYRVLASP